ncbi:MAG TPA: LysR family transcriptional regulator [Candidatus Limosilactobacillus intestinigallinarum]|nr:LysR family transcriptional regulator [Candidatus Limosilactobacillus intestinigallinarum]
MYNPLLDTFLIVAQELSFTRAGKRLFISHTAVMKQINTLESQLGVSLFDRDNQGVKLTSAGGKLLAALPQYLSMSRQLLQRIRQEPQEIRVGISPLYPIHEFLRWWRKNPHKTSLILVPFQDDFMGGLARDFDFFIGAFDDPRKTSQLIFSPLGNYQLGFQVPVKSQLTHRQVITPEDLRGQTIMMLEEGISPANDEMRSTVEKYCKRIIDVPERYSLATFNKCVKNGYLLVAPDCWRDVHPALRPIPFSRSFAIPYGIVTRKNKLWIIQQLTELRRQA